MAVVVQRFPSRMVFTFNTPTLSNLTNSPYAKSMGPIIRPLVMLNHSIRRLFDSMSRYQAFRAARKALQEFKRGLKRQPLPPWFLLLHIVAGALAWIGFWQLMRWFGIW